MKYTTLLMIALGLSLVACEQNKATSTKTDKKAHANHKHQHGDKGHKHDHKGAQKDHDHKGHDHKGHAGHDHQHGHKHDHKGHDHKHAADQANANIPKDQSGKKLSENKHYWVEYTPSINPIPFQKLFDLDVKVFDGKDKKTPIATAKLDQVRAIMPAHKHGMNVKPVVESKGKGQFQVKGMRFHMKGQGEHGQWVLEMIINDGKTIDTVKYDLQCCRS